VILGSIKFLVVGEIWTSSGRIAMPRPHWQTCVLVESSGEFSGKVPLTAEVNLSKTLAVGLLPVALDWPGPKADSPNPKRTMISEKLIPIMFGNESRIIPVTTLPEV